MRADPQPLSILPVPGLPEIHRGDDLAALIAARVALCDGDVVVVAQKVVSKAEGALVTPQPGETRAAARRRLVREAARRVVAETAEVVIAETVHGFVCAYAGIDASNVPDGQLSLLPEDADASARRLRAGLQQAAHADVAVIVADTFGRPWRNGQTDVAIGVAGLAPLRDERGGVDRNGLRLDATQVAVADELAGAADLVRRKAGGVPVVVIRGFPFVAEQRASSRALVRDPQEDLFRYGRGGLAAALTRQQPGGVRASAAALRAAIAAARAVAGDIGMHVRDEAAETLILIEGERSRAGAAGGVLVAALADFGCSSRLTFVAHGVVVTVDGGRDDGGDR